ncbi:sensor histidine kinase [Pilimelia columellifera]|uniref:histidine kinase n=1 Tax=Pilimelia columellifera subsp. columellifera TaxID=706583 RepID=A0ABN3NRD0_9ACTN
MEGDRTGAVRAYLLDRVRASVDALEHLVGGLATSLLALAALFYGLVVAMACVLGAGLLLAPSVVLVTRAVADRERIRLARWGPEIIAPVPPPGSLNAAVRDTGVRREFAWVAVHGTFGLGIGVVGLTLPLHAAQSLTFPLWYRLISPEAGGPGLVFWRIDGLADALAVGLLGVGWVAVVIGVGPVLARIQAWAGHRLLTPPGDADLSVRVVQLTATRAAALDAHAAELRRIERSLHDGTQNRMVAVTVLLGAARQALSRDPATADSALGRAQDAAEQALAELRSIVRGILPPVLADRGLIGALNGLTSSCPVPCQLDVDLPGRCAASVEATAYFIVAEALTNVTRHSGAALATVTVRRDGDRLRLCVHDDGLGGADEARGSGLTGIRRRVEAYDGTLSVTSPGGGPTSVRVELPCGS